MRIRCGTWHVRMRAGARRVESNPCPVQFSPPLTDEKKCTGHQDLPTQATQRHLRNPPPTVTKGRGGWGGEGCVCFVFVCMVTWQWWCPVHFFASVRGGENCRGHRVGRQVAHGHTHPTVGPACPHPNSRSLSLVLSPGRMRTAQIRRTGEYSASTRGKGGRETQPGWRTRDKGWLRWHPCHRPVSIVIM